MVSVTLILILTGLISSAYAMVDPCTTQNATAGPICSGHGVCYNDSSSNETRCYCDSGYTNLDCSYQRKSQAVAFGLTWLYLIGLAGVERLYLGYTAIGIVFLLMGLSGVIFLVGSFIGGMYRFIDRSGDRGCVMSAVCVAAIGFADLAALLGLWIWELVIISQGTLNDAHGYSMAPW
jgi:TM2 domain-containing membrane protein YozV